MNNQFFFTAEINTPEYLNDWLNCSTSLTDKLQAITGSAELEVMSQEWVTPNWFDNYVFHIQDIRVLNREIMMRSHGTAYWYARSVIPESCYRVDSAFFNRLEKESI